MENLKKQKILSIVKGVFFALLAISVVGFLVDAISLDWTMSDLEGHAGFMKLLINSRWILFSFGLAALAFIAINFFSNKFKPLKILLLTAFATTAIVFAVLIKNDCPVYSSSYTSKYVTDSTLLLTQFSSLMMALFFAAAYLCIDVVQVFAFKKETLKVQRNSKFHLYALAGAVLVFVASLICAIHFPTLTTYAQCKPTVSVSESGNYFVVKNDSDIAVLNMEVLQCYKNGTKQIYSGSLTVGASRSFNRDEIKEVRVVYYQLAGEKDLSLVGFCLIPLVLMSAYFAVNEVIKLATTKKSNKEKLELANDKKEKIEE